MPSTAVRQPFASARSGTSLSSAKAVVASPGRKPMVGAKTTSGNGAGHPTLPDTSGVCLNSNKHTRPTAGLKIVTWNCNSALQCKLQLLELLDDHQPHLVCLQESRCDQSLASALRGDFSRAGYSLVAGHDLSILVKHGVNAAPIAPMEGDAVWHLQRIAIQVGPLRLLLRHRHGHSSLSSERKLMEQHLREQGAELCIDIGDF